MAEYEQHTIRTSVEMVAEEVMRMTNDGWTYARSDTDDYKNFVLVFVRRNQSTSVAEFVEVVGDYKRVKCLRNYISPNLHDHASDYWSFLQVLNIPGDPNYVEMYFQRKFKSKVINVIDDAKLTRALYGALSEMIGTDDDNEATSTIYSYTKRINCKELALRVGEQLDKDRR